MLLIIEFLLELCYNAVLYGKYIRLDEQSFVGLNSRNKFLPCFKRIQPVFSRTVFLRDVVNRDGCAWVYIVGVNFAGVFSIISVLIFLRWDVQVFECLQILLKI